MSQPTPPQVFAPARRIAARKRAQGLQAHADAARYVLDDMVEDVIERVAFLRVEPRRALVIGDRTGVLAANLRQQGCTVTEAEPADGFAEERPIPEGGFDLVASLGALDTVNDLPGALIHIRNALASGGLAIASLMGAGCLPQLRAAMLAADGDRPAPRLHPMVDVRAGGNCSNAPDGPIRWWTVVRSTYGSARWTVWWRICGRWASAMSLPAPGRR